MLGRLSSPILADDLQVEALFDESIVVVASTQSRWVGRREIDLAELTNEPWILAPPTTRRARSSRTPFARRAWNRRARGLPPTRCNCACSFWLAVDISRYSRTRLCGIAPSVGHSQRCLETRAEVARRSCDLEESNSHAFGAIVHRTGAGRDEDDALIRRDNLLGVNTRMRGAQNPLKLFERDLSGAAPPGRLSRPEATSQSKTDCSASFRRCRWSPLAVRYREDSATTAPGRSAKSTTVRFSASVAGWHRAPALYRLLVIALTPHLARVGTGSGSRYPARASRLPSLDRERAQNARAVPNRALQNQHVTVPQAEGE